MTTNTFLLPRSGQAPLQIEGELICVSDGRFKHNGKEYDRYHVLEVYRLARTPVSENTDGGLYALWIGYVSNWKGKRTEPGHDYAAVFASPQYVADALVAYDPS